MLLGGLQDVDVTVFFFSLYKYIGTYRCVYLPLCETYLHPIHNKTYRSLFSSYPLVEHLGSPSHQVLKVYHCVQRRHSGTRPLFVVEVLLSCNTVLERILKLNFLHVIIESLVTTILEVRNLLLF